MRINSITNANISIKGNTTISNQKKPVSWGKITGFGTLGCGIGSIVAAQNKKIKIHKNLGMASIILVLLHIPAIEMSKHHHNNIEQ